MSERAIFDLRVWVTGHSEQHVYDLINHFVERSRDVAPPGVDVRYSHLRDGTKTRRFDATITRGRR